MAKFITLTTTSEDRAKIHVNIDNVLYFGSLNQNKATRIIFSMEPDSSDAYVFETPEEILKLINPDTNSKLPEGNFGKAMRGEL